MSYNGSGTFQINTSGQPVVTGTSISSTVFNALTADLATGLSTAITKDGQTTTTARIPFALGINSTLVTDATNTTSGSIITAGGVGIAKAVFVGTTLNVAGASTMTGSIAVDSVTDSSSTTTGSIQTDGGVGIAKALYVGTTANVAGIATLTSNPVLSAGTANGVAYLNGSKALTTGSALVFDGTNFSTTGTIKGATTFGVGNATPSTSGAGITFPATQSASTDVNTLDDYEEGTWSSAVTNAANLTGTGSLDRAVYTKIGRLVTIVGRITGQTITTVTTGTAAGLTLPFAMIATDSIVMGTCRGSTSTEMIGIILDATGADATSVNLNFPAAQITANGAATFSFSLTYQASA